MSKNTFRYKRKKLVSFSDEELMRLFALENNELAFEELYKRYFTPLTKYVSWMSKDIDLSKDIVQGVFSKLYVNSNLYKAEEGVFKTWIYASAKNKLTNQWRDVKNRNRILEETQYVNIQASSISDDSARLKQINKALESLSENHREVFVLKYSSNLTIKEISDIYNCSEGTVKSRLFYAMKSIKEIIDIKNSR